jgi:hypothetical protein
VGDEPGKFPPQKIFLLHFLRIDSAFRVH